MYTVVYFDLDDFKNAKMCLLENEREQRLKKKKNVDPNSGRLKNWRRK